jgi:hypothetical protein
MSGGRWNYQKDKIEERADQIAAFLKAVAQTERIVDWAECGDTRREDAEHELYDLWVKTFDAQLEWGG